MKQKILVWDVPTLVFHWLLVMSFGAAFWAADSMLTLQPHVVFGYMFLGLLVFRVVWGCVGTRYAKFASFWFNPHEIFSYAQSMWRGKPAAFIGHNPVGSLAIWALLALGFLCSLAGVFAYQELAKDFMEQVHRLSAYLMLGVVVVHVLGVLMSSVLHGENLIGAMLTGRKWGRKTDAIEHRYSLLGATIVLCVLVFLSLNLH
jgi:cytochrome b